MSKSRQLKRDSHSSSKLVPREVRPVYVGDRPFQRLSGVVPSGEAAYMEGFPNRQTVFALLFQKFLDFLG